MSAPFRNPLAETFVVVIRDRANGKLTLCETDAGASLKDAAGDLALGTVYRGFDPVQVVSTTAGDVTARVLHEVAHIVEAEDRELDERLEPVFEAYGVPLPVRDVPGSYEDDVAEHRPTAFDLGVGRFA